MERRQSLESNDGMLNKQASEDILPQSRVSKVTSPKPNTNALQFVKVGPCDLYRTAQEQLKKVQEIKKTAKKEIKEDAEDWQSNLDNWKSCRRKRQEHIIERVVEVKKLEFEEHERNRRRSKTFNEMMQDRTVRGRKHSLPVYEEDVSNDLSDLGINNGKSDESSTASDDGSQWDSSRDNSIDEKSENHNSTLFNGTSTNYEVDSEEYTYDKAIQSYVNFAENRVKSISSRSIEEESVKSSLPIPVKPRRSSQPKIESTLIKFEKRSESTSDVNCDKGKKSIPKVDIGKRRELFEKTCDSETKSIKLVPDISSTKTIKDRVCFLEKKSDKQTISDKVITEKLVKDRLIALDKSKTNEDNSQKKLTEQITTTSIKDRLSSLKQSKNHTIKNSATVESDTTLKERLSSLHSSCNKEIMKTISKSLENKSVNRIELQTEIQESPSSPDLYNKQIHYRHRSLDSLDIESDGVRNENFDRVQSYEDLEYCRNYPPSSMSGDTDREDSGIHTADVSSSVSQADDYDLHLDNNSIVDDSKVNHQQTILKTNTISVNLSNNEIFNNSDIVSDNKSSVVMDEKYSLSSKTEALEPIYECTNETVNLFNSIGQKNDEINLENIEFNLQPSNLNNSTSCLLINSYGFDSNKKSEVHSEQSVEDISNELNSSNISVIEVPSAKQKIEIFENFKENNQKDLPVNIDVMYSERKLKEYNLYSSQQKLELNGGSVLNLNETNDADVFPLSPTTLEPPKEKPPPPPLAELSDEEIQINNNMKSIRRLDSTKRIKKEIRQKRSSFLGLEGNDDESYMNNEIELIRPPDMITLLTEERRLEKQLYRQSVCSETDSNQESRDSGVELDHKTTENGWNHSRHDSETFGNQSTSDEDEIIKKEREIIETLEQEEKIRKQNLGEKLALRLRELEAESDQVTWSQVPEKIIKNKHCMERLNEVENSVYQVNNGGEHLQHSDMILNPEAYGMQHTWCDPRQTNSNTRSSLQDVHFLNGNVQRLNSNLPLEYRYSYHDLVAASDSYTRDLRSSYQDLPNTVKKINTPVSKSIIIPAHARRSMPDLSHRRPPPPPPIQPATKQLVRHQIVDGPKITPQQISRQTIQALSAAPRSRIISNDMWHTKRKTNKMDNCNYQHWLIQEAEHRRLTEQANKNSRSSAKHLQQNIEVQPIINGPTWSSLLHKPIYTSTPLPPLHLPHHIKREKPLPDSVIQTLTQRVQNRQMSMLSFDSNNNRKRYEMNSLPCPDSNHEKMLSVSGKKKCSSCSEELGRGAAMIIESLQLYYHIDCFKCCVCCLQLGDGLMGTDVRVRNDKLHCRNCYSSDDGA